MKKVLLAVVVIAAAVGGAGYYFFRTHPEASPTEVLDAATGYLKGSLDYAKQVTQRISARPQQGAPAAATPKAVNPALSGKGGVKAPAPASPSYQPKNLVTLYLTNGGIVTGDLVKETPETVTLRWEYGDVSFARNEIKRQADGEAAEGHAPSSDVEE